jgi:uncharacterized membrane protein
MQNVIYPKLPVKVEIALDMNGEPEKYSRIDRPTVLSFRNALILTIAVVHYWARELNVNATE